MADKKVPKITMIQAQKRAGRYNIFLDEQYAFPVSEETLIHFQLGRGTEVDAKFKEDIEAYEGIARAYSRSLDYLTGQLRTELEVRHKLRDLEYSDDIQDEVVQRLIQQNLINDGTYADSFVRTMMNTSDKGPKIITQKLKQKGISDNLIADALSQMTNINEEELALNVAEKLIRHYQRESQRGMQQKIRQNLLAKGFNSDIISDVIQKMPVSSGEDEFEKIQVMGDKIWNRNRRWGFKKRKLKTKQALFNKGFQIDVIDRFLQTKIDE